LPDLQSFSALLRGSELPHEAKFTVVDLFRCALVDPRVSGYFAEEQGHDTVVALLDYTNSRGTDCPYALRLVTLQMTCNLFSSPLYPEQILSQSMLRNPITQLVSTSFLDDSHNNVRVAAASLLFNISSANSKKRRDGHPRDVLPESDQVELAASVLEAITQETSSAEALHGMLLALGYLVYCAPLDGELVDLLRTMDAEDTILAKSKHFPQEDLIKEVGEELLRKGLRKP
jgi:desumoylating isopeptidase 1